MLDLILYYVLIVAVSAASLLIQAIWQTQWHLLHRTSRQQSCHWLQWWYGGCDTPTEVMVKKFETALLWALVLAAVCGEALLRRGAV